MLGRWRTCPGVVGIPLFGTDEQKATAIRDDVESRLWPLFEKFFGRVPLSDGDQALYSERNGGDGRYDIVLVRLGPSRAGQSPSVTKRVTTAPPARFSMVNRALTETQLARKGRPRTDARISLRVRECRAAAVGSTKRPPPGRSISSKPETQHGARVCERFLSGCLSRRSPTIRPTGIATNTGLDLFLFFLQHHGTSAPGGKPEIVRAIWEQTKKWDPVSAIKSVMDVAMNGLSRGMARIHEGQLERQIRHHQSGWNEGPHLHGVGSAARWDLAPQGACDTRSAWRRTGVRHHDSAIRNPRGSLEREPATAERGLFRVPFRHHRPIGSGLTHDLRDLGATGAELVVFTKQGGQWTIQPSSTSQNTNGFCRDRAGERIDEMVVILGNSGTSRHINFVSGMVAPAVSATSNGCLGSMDVDTGYEECQLNFPGTGNSRMDYRHFEKQTWEITRLKSRSATQALYDYRWTSQGKGTSVNWPWSATWDMSSQQNSVSGSVRKYKMGSRAGRCQ